MSIMNFLKGAIIKALSNTELLACYTLRKQGFFFEVGWFNSWKEKRSVDAAGRPIPWITYPCLAFLQPRITRNIEVFEFGCGNSTLWWAERVSTVVCCEHNPDWYAEMKTRISPNVQLELRMIDDGYAAFIEKFPGRFHVVVIDGPDRVNCIRRSLVALTPDGVLVLDNSERHEYSEGIEFLLRQGFRRLDFEGPGPITTARWSTTVFYRPQNFMGI